jgi:hypothetical protein
MTSSGSPGGGPLPYCSAMAMVRLRTKKHFGISFGPHRFRTSLTTTQAVIDGKDPLGASLILGHSPDIGLKDYNCANALDASRRHDARISEAEDAAARMLGRRLNGASNKPATSRHSSNRRNKSEPATRRDIPGFPIPGQSKALTSPRKRAKRRGPQRG